MITRESLIDPRQYLQDYIEKRGGPIAVSPDLDGWMTGLVLTNLCCCTVVAVYNNRQLAFRKGANLFDVVYTDIDIADKRFISIGHHMPFYSKDYEPDWYHPQSIQLNKEAGIYMSGKSPYDFAFKYPCSTTLFLLWLLDHPFHKMDKWGQYLISQADGTLNNFGKYAHSVNNWITLMFGEYVNPIGEIDRYADLRFTPKYRDMRRNTIQSPGKGQGKGIEKIQTIDVGDNGVLRERHREFIHQIGDAIGFPYDPARWQCWDNMNLLRLASFSYNSQNRQNDETTMVETIKTLIRRTDIVSMIFPNTNRIDYTVGDLAAGMN